MSIKLKFILTLLGLSAVVLPIILAGLNNNLKDKQHLPKTVSSNKTQGPNFDKNLETVSPIRYGTESVKLATPSVRPATRSAR